MRRCFLVLVALTGVGCGPSPCESCLDAGDATVARDAGRDGARDARVIGDPPMDAGADSAAPDAGPVEVCTRSITGAVPADEDGDTSIDEGCPWHFGPSYEVRFTNGPPSFWNLAPRKVTIAGNGRRMYYVAADWNGSSNDYSVRTATRASRAEAFEPSADVSFAGAPPAIIAVTDDERLALSTSGNDVLEQRRANADDAFGTPVVVGTYEGPIDIFVTRDGREIWFGSSQVSGIFRARRASIDESFGPAEPATITASGPRAPTLSPDGRTIFFHRFIDGALYRATRANRETLTFDEPVLIDFAATGSANNLRVQAFFHEETQELFAIAGGSSSPSFAVVVRTRVCRDGPCPTIELPCAGVRTVDGAHCFTHQPGQAAWAAAESACVAAGAHLASIHTNEEATIVSDLAAGSLTWIGLTDSAVDGQFTWTSGEWAQPLANYLPFDQGQPDNDTSVLAEGEDCVALPVDSDADGREVWADDECTNAHAYVCEHAIWPTW